MLGDDKRPPRPLQRSGGVVISPMEVDDMNHAIAKVFGPLLCRLFPSSRRLVRPYLVAYERAHGLDVAA